MKKIVSTLLSLLLLATLATPVLAAETAGAEAANGETVSGVMGGEGGYAPDFYTAQKLTLPQKKVTLTVGSKVKFIPTAFGEEGRSQMIYFSYRSNGVATFSREGVLRGRKPGKMTITFTSGKAKAKLNVTVVAKSAKTKVKSIKANVSAMNVGETKRIRASFKPANATNAVVTYKSSAPSVATINEAGFVTALNGGTTVITVKAANKTKKYTLRVNEPVTQAPAVPFPTTGWVECPELRTFTAGVDIAAGEYVLMDNPADETATYMAIRDAAGVIIYSDNFTTQRYAYLQPGQTLTVSRGKFISSDYVPAFTAVNGVYSDGMYKVGRDIPTGTYTITGTRPNRSGECEVFKDGIISHNSRAPRIYAGYGVKSKAFHVRDGEYILISGATMAKV